jgi:hypothetical protein
MDSDDLYDRQTLLPGNFIEIIHYEQNSSIPKGKPWIIQKYDKINDTVKIMLLNKKQSIYIESWRIVPIKFNMSKNNINELIGGKSDDLSIILTDEE